MTRRGEERIVKCTKLTVARVPHGRWLGVGTGKGRIDRLSSVCY